MRARLLDPEQACQGTEAGQSEPVLTWQQHLACSGEQHVDLGRVALQQPQLWWPLHMGAQVQGPLLRPSIAEDLHWLECGWGCMAQAATSSGRHVELAGLAGRRWPAEQPPHVPARSSSCLLMPCRLCTAWRSKSW